MPFILPVICLLLVLPLIEIYVLISVGHVIGAWQTVLLVVATAAIGAIMLRVQGLRTLARVQDALQRGELPAQALLEGVVLLLTGVLLLTPGFVTDAVGFVCLLPGVRRGLARLLGARLFAGKSRRPPATSRVLEGDFKVDGE